MFTKKGVTLRLLSAEITRMFVDGPDSIPDDFSVDSPFILPAAVIKAY